jgi:perosamine synthetase
MDPADVARKITPRTRAIMPVALYGLAPDLDALAEIGREHGIVMLEDDAQALTSLYKGRVVGSIGEMASFSFQSSKQWTSGEGGMLVTADEELATAIRRVGSLGYAGVGSRKGKITKDDIQDPSYARHVSLGFNYRMPELCAAVALAQLERRDELVGRRVAVGELFRDVVSGCDWMHAQAVPDGLTNSYWTFAAVVDHPSASWHDFRERFLANGGDAFYGAWRLTYREPMFGNETATGVCPVAEWLQPRLVQLKTNYWRWDDAEQQADALRRTLEDLS